MIDLHYIAEQYNKMLGTNDYIVYLDTNLTPHEDDTDRTLCVMTASRNPQALGGAIDSETLTLSFAFDIVISKKEQAAKRKAGITQILGWQSFQVHTPEGETYDVDSWLDLIAPDPARVDEGQLKQILSVGGTALVANHETGAIVSNRIKTYVDGEELTVMNYSAALTKGTDELINLSDDSFQIEPCEISQTNTADITALYTGSEIDKFFRNLIENGSSEHINKVYKIARSYPDGVTALKSMKLIEASNTGQAGAYFYYHLSFRNVSDGSVIGGKIASGMTATLSETVSPGATVIGTATVDYLNAESDSDVTWDTSGLPPFCSVTRSNGSIIIKNNSPASGASLQQTTCTVTVRANTDSAAVHSFSLIIPYYKAVESVSVISIPNSTFNGEYVPFNATVRLMATVLYNDGTTDSDVTWSIAVSAGSGLTITGISISGGYLTNESSGSDGDDITAIVTASATLDASQNGTLTLTCEGGMNYYSISYVNVDHATAGGPVSAREYDEVTIYGEADENYTVTNISAWTGYGTEDPTRIAQSEDSDELTFVMPASDVTITVSYTDY